ncbi:WXG100 family type VII secretion target [Streptomyces sp. NPDC021093]|uniref:WXG100 family type VII secretion target n=1 Tax=Streptomyces sp. NPDC021093 TaxID=3365112 RepID=UPI0037AAC2B6
MSTLDVDPEKLGKSSADLDKVAEKIKLIKEDYIDKITSYHGCWGDGEFGEAFAKKYLPGVDAARKGVKELSSALEGSSQSLKDAAKDFKNQQQQILDGLGQHGGSRR